MMTNMDIVHTCAYIYIHLAHNNMYYDLVKWIYDGAYNI